MDANHLKTTKGMKKFVKVSCLSRKWWSVKFIFALGEEGENTNRILWLLTKDQRCAQRASSVAGEHGVAHAKLQAIRPRNRLTKR